jgi:hypothetical protein
MRGAFGILVGLGVFAVGLAGLAYALLQMTTHADPNASLHAAAGLGTFIAAVLASIFVIR